MPTVERYGPRRVGTTPLPGARRTASETSLSTGAELSRERARTDQVAAQVIGGAAEYALGKAGELIKAERQRANRTALMEAENRLAAWENERLYNPESGAYSQKGKSAMGLPETVGDEYRTLVDEVQANLSNDEQREAFAEIQAKRGLQLDLSIRRHVLQEMNAYEANELANYVDNARNAAIANAHDPRRVGLEIGNAVSAIETQGRDLGWGDEEVEAKVAQVRTQIHTGVIDRYLSEDRVDAATVYFEETRGQINGDSIAKIERALEEGSLRVEAQEKSDEIIAAGGSQAEMRAKARELTGKLRDEVMSRIEHEWTVKERQEREAKEAGSRSIYDAIEGGAGLAAIERLPAWREMSGPERASARRYLEDRAAGIPTRTNLRRYYELIDLASSKPEEFATLNLYADVGRLSESDFKSLAGLQASTRRRESTDDTLSPLRTRSQLLSDIMGRSGLEADSEQGLTVRRELDRRVEAYQQNTGREMSNADIETMADRLVSDVVLQRGSWLSFLPGGAPFFDQTKKAYDVTYEDIPMQDRKLIEDRLRAAGRPVSSDTVLDTFVSWRLATQGAR